MSESLRAVGSVLGWVLAIVVFLVAERMALGGPEPTIGDAAFMLAAIALYRTYRP